ncbi:MAG TPA: hypothetical protein DEG96_01020 [Candidatus Atribacteria bacterium]|nr:hypothetical protein [Candidatus Atribacteria bacterium]
MRCKDFKNKKIKGIFTNQKGFALLTTLIFVFVLATLVITLLTMTNNDTKLSNLQRESTRAFYIAETGIDEALLLLNTPVNQGGKGLDWRPGTDLNDPPEPSYIKNLSPNEYYEVIITGDSDNITILSKGVVTGSGTYDKGMRQIEVKCKKGIAKAPDLFFDYAVLTNGNMTINGGVSFHGNIHSNGNLTNNGNINLEYGTATATGTTNFGTGGVPYQEFPRIDWEYYENQAKTQLIDDEGNIHNHYYSGDVTIDSSGSIYGIHYIDGNVEIKPPCSELHIIDGAIFATGTITVGGSSNVYIEKSKDYDNPLALVAKGDIVIWGNVHGEGIVYTENNFTLNGNINIQKGAVYADDGVFHGGGGSMNIYYDTDLINTPVPGTGIPVWKKVSWQEVFDF